MPLSIRHRFDVFTSAPCLYQPYPRVHCLGCMLWTCVLRFSRLILIIYDTFLLPDVHDSFIPGLDSFLHGLASNYTCVSLYSEFLHFYTGHREITVSRTPVPWLCFVAMPNRHRPECPPGWRCFYFQSCAKEYFCLCPRWHCLNELISLKTGCSSVMDHLKWRWFINISIIKTCCTWTPQRYELMSGD